MQPALQGPATLTLGGILLGSSKEELVEVVFVRSEDNWSDGMTKNVSSDIHVSHSGHVVVNKEEV
jgi:hypothetical protein